MSNRFFIDSPITSDIVSLGGPEAHHLKRVMRCDVGSQVVLFDGSGAEFAARVAQIDKSRVELEVLARHNIDRELPFPLTLGVALPKGDRQRRLTEKAVELGVTRLVPLKTVRGVAQPVERAVERLKRAVIEAAKQCGRNRLMEIAEPKSLNDYLQSAPKDALRLIAHPNGEATRPPTQSAVFLAVGPEGGFTGEELEVALRNGWHMASLGPRTLRVETAAVALTASLVVALAESSRIEC